MGSGKGGKGIIQPGQKRNYQKELNKFIEGLQREGHILKLLLHSCCTPCGSYVPEYPSQYFDVTVYYYNPNIFPEAEYEARVKGQEHLIREMTAAKPARFLTGNYEPGGLFSTARGHEKGPERGERCHHHYELCLGRAAREVTSGNFNLLTTTLSISPLKNARWLNDIRCRLADQYGILYLVSDFRKKNGYKHSVELSALYELYRQDYCGYVYSRAKA